jgi:vancomycin resistance protein YoaR
MRRLFILSLFASLVLTPGLAHANTILTKEVLIAPDRATAARSRSFTLVAGSRTWVVPTAETRLWFKTRSSDDGTTLLQLRPGALYDYFNVYVSPRVNQLGANSRFVDVGGNLHLLSPGYKGKTVDGIKTSLAIRDALVAGKITATVAMQEYRPAIFSAADFKKLSFPNLLARGESSFAGSPRNRVHNINVATQRFNGVVLLPDDIFSFNQYLGTVDAANNYLPELVIKENVTTPEFGGGICQVSTTAFRGALQAGLKITARRNHSYPVRYYGAPGFDATVYQPAPDLQFVNDTGQPVMLKTSVAGTKVIFEVWGTADGRQITINGPFVTEKKPDGSLTAAIAQIVKKNGKSIREQNFVSHYQSPDKFPTIRKANGG